MELLRSAGWGLAQLRCGVGLWHGQDLDAFLKAAKRLANAREMLLVVTESEELDTRNEAGAKRLATFLELLSETCSGYATEVADRSYRKHFTKNYRILFPDLELRYPGSAQNQ